MNKLIRIAAALTILLGLVTLRCGTCCVTTCCPVVIDDSSAINSYHYDKARQELSIEFTDGQSYLIQEVPEPIFHAFSKAESKGQYYNQDIKGQFPSKKQ